MKKQSINEGFAEFLKVFIPKEQIEELLELTEMKEIELLTDFTIYCHEADCLMNAKTWEIYHDETLNFF